MSRISSILTALSIFTLGCVLAVPATAGSPRASDGGNYMTNFNPTFLFGGGNASNRSNEGVSNSTIASGITSTTQDVDPNPYGLDPKEMERATREAVRQVEKLANELRGNEGGGEISDTPETRDNDTISAPY